MKKDCPIRGFTIVELLVVIGMFAILFAFSTVNLFNIQPSTSYATDESLIISDIREQAIRAMSGDSSSVASITHYDWGIYFETSRYTLFRGSIYNSSDPSNYVVNLDSGVQFSVIDLPSQSIVFSRVTGEVVGFQATHNSVTLQNTFTSQQKIISINAYGVVSVN